MTRTTLKTLSSIAMSRPVNQKDREPLQRLSFNPYELIELQEMDTKELRGLMCFCGIRVYQDLPVIACDDDELRMAYLVWRSYYSREKRLQVNKKLSWFKKWGFRSYDGVEDTMNIF